MNFQSSQLSVRVTFAVTPWNPVSKLQIGPWQKLQSRGGGFRQDSGDLPRRWRGASGAKGKGVQDAPAGGLSWGGCGREVGRRRTEPPPASGTHGAATTSVPNPDQAPLQVRLDLL